MLLTNEDGNALQGISSNFCKAQSDKISHIAMEDDHLDTVISHIDIQDDHIDIPYPTSITRIPYRYSYRYPINVRSPISISHIDIGSYLVTLSARPYPAAAAAAAEAAAEAAEAAGSV